MVLSHKSNECGVNMTGSFPEYVLSIAQHKMQNIIIPPSNELLSPTSIIFVLTADTLVQTKQSKAILGKPKDKDDARRMLRLLCEEPVDLATGCCLEKKQYDGKQWNTIVSKHWVTMAILEFCVEEEWVDRYFKKLPHTIHSCAAGAVEEFGLNFLKNIEGSFTATLGLPLFELRQKLKLMNFF